MATSDIISGGNIEPRGLEEEMRSSYLDYAMSVIVGRALPDVRDGLKPVHRRALFSMNENGLQPDPAASGRVRVADPAASEDHPSGREVRALHVLHQALDVDLGVVDVRDHRVDRLAQVVRRDVRRHPDRDPRRAVDEQVREPTTPRSTW